MVGSTECALIWKAKRTPAGQSISRLARWTPPTSEADSTGSPWPTPTDRDCSSSRRHGYMLTGHPGTTLTDAADLAGERASWATPKNSDHRPGHLSLATDERRRRNLNDQAHGAATTWATPAARDYRFPNSPESQETRNADSARGQQLPNEAAHLYPATWRTPMASDSKWRATDAVSAERASTGRTLGLHDQILVSGTTPNGSLEPPTAKRGGLNPEFVCWLMGYPAAWLSCVDWATLSSRKSPRK